MSQKRYLCRLERKIAPPAICNVVVPTLLSTKSSINTDLLKKAVYHFITVQPNFNAGVKKIDDGNWKFVPLEKIEDVFEVLPDKYNWKDICLRYSSSHLREPLKCEFYSPLKVFFIKQSNASAYLIPVYMHYAADGTNGMTIVHDILKAYMQLCGGEELDTTPFPPPPSVDDMALSGLTDTHEKLKENYETYTRGVYKSLNCFLPFEEINVTEALYYASTNNVYENFLKACRYYKVSVGAALTASMFFGFGGYIFGAEAICAEQLNLSVNIPINLRDRVSNNTASNCCNLSVTQFLLGCSIKKGTTFWELARQIRETLLEKMSDNHKFHMFDFGCNESVCNSEEKKTAMDKFEVSQQFCVSNMRRFPGCIDFGEFTIESIHCVGGLWITKWDVMELMIYSTNKFNLSMIHRQGVENTKRAEHVFKYVKYIVEYAGAWQKDETLENCMRYVKNL